MFEKTINSRRAQGNESNSHLYTTQLPETAHLTLRPHEVSIKRPQHLANPAPREISDISQDFQQPKATQNSETSILPNNLCSHTTTLSIQQRNTHQMPALPPEKNDPKKDCGACQKRPCICGKSMPNPQPRRGGGTQPPPPSPAPEPEPRR